MTDGKDAADTLLPHWQKYSREFLEAVVEKFAPDNVPNLDGMVGQPVELYMCEQAACQHHAVKKYLASGKPAGKMGDDERKMLEGMLDALEFARRVDEANYALMDDVSFR